MNVLITGLTGFVGSHLADYLLSLNQDIRIYGLARWRSPLDNIKHIKNDVTILYGDLLDLPSLQSIMDKVRPEFIFHLAAQSYVPYSFDAPIATLESNAIGTCNLLEAIKSCKLSTGCDPIVHICSSSEVYGQVEANEIPIRETNPFRPASPYAVSKTCEDMLAYQYWASWKIKTIRTRLFTHTGPRRGEVFALSNFAKQIALIEKGLQTPVVKVGNINSIRTWMDVRDAVKAYWLLVNKCKPGEVYNVGGNVTMTIAEMLNKLIGISSNKNITIEVDLDRLRPSDVTRQIPCCDKFKSETGWEPEIDFETTIQDTLDYWRANT